MNSGFQWIGQSLDGNSVTLYKFNGKFNLASYATPQWMSENADKVKMGVVIDVETTGLNRKADTVIEIGLRQFYFNRATGELLSLGESYSALQDPGKPLPDSVKKVTGLTDEMLIGKKIDWQRVDSLLSAANIILAHNAAFDRPFIERNSKTSSDKPWGCSLKQVDWAAKGYSVQKLDVLSIYHGFFTDAHRALNDSEALLHLLSMNDWRTNRPYLNELLSNARRPIVRVSASNSPFETKDLLKERGYQWEMNSKVWQKTIFKEDMSHEVAWLESAVYKGDFKGRTEEIPLTDQFK